MKLQVNNKNQRWQNNKIYLKEKIKKKLKSKMIKQRNKNKNHKNK